VTDELLEEQVRYYRARASEYDATSPHDAHQFQAVFARVRDDLAAQGPVDRAIELGAGTGQFTGALAAIAGHVTAVDTAPEVLEILRARIDAPNVDTVVGDVLAWVPDEPADLVVFAALFSHIPRARFDAFWAAIDRMLAPGGRVFMIDEAPHELWAEDWTADDEIVVRTVGDGQAFHVVKVLWDPEDLSRRVSDVGWRASFTREDPLYWGVVERA
jgi:demethylmenaquinone methyltransferase/2-methoxy-6-polyprenyl-1,4-benzoquinol methylase